MKLLEKVRRKNKMLIFQNKIHFTFPPLFFTPCWQSTNLPNFSIVIISESKCHVVTTSCSDGVTGCRSNIISKCALLNGASKSQLWDPHLLSHPRQVLPPRDEKGLTIISTAALFSTSPCPQPRD